MLRTLKNSAQEQTFSEFYKGMVLLVVMFGRLTKHDCKRVLTADEIFALSHRIDIKRLE